MSDRSRRSVTVHWIGAGLSTGQGLARICDAADRVCLWNRTVGRAEHLVRRLGLENTVHTRTLTSEALAAALQPGDVLVSMLPATMHGDLLAMAIDAGAHFVSTSYVDDTVRERAKEARARGLAVVMEAGLDPGIDHLAAHLLVDSALDAVGRQPVIATFHSHCGGLPEKPNDFRYRFSWAPVGVLRALRTEARYVRDSVVQVAPSPWEATRPIAVRCELFEAYPNRDSLPFLAQYRFPDSWDVSAFERGTLRLRGWQSAWQDVFQTVKHGTDDDIAALAGELAEHHRYGPKDRDRVVLNVSLSLRQNGRRIWQGEYGMDVVGDDGDSAMARCVSSTAACAVLDLIDGRTTPGLHLPIGNARDAKRWLARLEGWGIRLSQAVAEDFII